MPLTPHARGTLIALAATCLWATTGIIISYLLDHYPIHAFTLAFWRDVFMAGALILVLAVRAPHLLRLTRGDVAFFFAYGFVLIAIFNSVWTVSVGLNGAAVTTVLAYSAPAFTLILAWPLLKEPLTVRKVLAVVLSLAGCVFVARMDSLEAWRVNPLGIATGLGTGLAFALYSLVGRWSARRFASPWTVTAYGFLFAAGGLALTQTPQTIFSLGTAWDAWALLIVLALGPSIGGFGLYTVSLRYLEAGTANLIAALEPVLTAVMAMFILHQFLDLKQWFGASLVLAAVVTMRSVQQPSADGTF